MTTPGSAISRAYTGISTYYYSFAFVEAIIHLEAKTRAQHFVASREPGGRVMAKL